MSDNDKLAILAIDQGTSGSKAIVFSTSGEILASFTKDYSLEYPKPGHVEICPEVLLDSVYAACEGALSEYRSTGGHLSDIRSLGISNQRESFLLWDKSGRAVTPIVVWQCKRSAYYCLELSGDSDFTALVREHTGLVIDPYFSGTKAAVIALENPELQKRIRSGEICFGTVDSWLIHSLTGNKVHATDRTNASRTMLYDINTLDWDEELISHFGLRGLVLPEVRTSDAGFGMTDLRGLLDEAIPIGGAIGDSHAAAFGQGIFRPGEAKITLGTGSSILMNTGSRPAVSTDGMVSTICWSLRERTDYALEGIVVSCGSTITWLRDKLGILTDSGEIDKLAEEVGDSAGVYLIPAFSGIGAPWWKQEAKASIVGLDFSHDRRHVARAALESIPFQVTDVLKAMAKNTGGMLSEIKADGGITVSSLVVESLSALAGCPVTIPAMKQASAWGAALLAGLNEGLYENLATIDKLISSRNTEIIKKEVTPELSARYEGWRKLMQDY